jgi:hypothetical protein
VKHDGRDGSHIPSVYPCYYSPLTNDSVIFKKYGKESLFTAICVAGSLAGTLVLSCFSLIIATCVVRVTERGKMEISACCGQNKSTAKDVVIKGNRGGCPGLSSQTGFFASP